MKIENRFCLSVGLLSCLTLSAGAAPQNVPAAAPQASVKTPEVVPPDTSTASLKETLDWICKAATTRQSNTFPGEEGALATLVEQKAAYSLRDNELTLTMSIKVDDKSTKDKAAFLARGKSIIPLSKLNTFVTIDRKNPTDVVIFSTDAAIDPADPLTPKNPDAGGQFHTIGEAWGMHSDSFVDRETVSFASVELAERAATAFRHLARLTSGKTVAKPAGEPF